MVPAAEWPAPPNNMNRNFFMIRKISLFSLILVALIAVAAGCSDIKREPGRVYMPDMAYSRAYETYSVTQAESDSLFSKYGAHFSNTPVPGTVKRGAMFPFLLTKDAAGDSTNYVASKAVRNPLTAMDTVEAERLYLVNCAICHGPKLDGNGPLYKDGQGPFSAAPANLTGKAQYTSMPEGQMYYSVTYGKNKMGSYASQLNTQQRWMVIAYIKSKQAAGKAGATTATATPAAAPAAPAGTSAAKDSTKAGTK
jgi:mono/diheme cytochrome c family protein